MAYVKINNTELVNMSTHIQKAFDALDEVEDIWGNKFAQLYADFVESGFLDSLYDDAESNFYQCLRAATAIGAATSVLLVIPVGGWVAWVVSVLFGVVAYALQGDPQWLTVSKEAFTQLLRSCKEYQDDNYIRISNLATKFYNMQLSIEKIRSKVDTFQSTANQVGATAEQMGLSTRTGGSDDGILLGVETEVVIDGKAVKMDAAEAMSALYTYAYTVTSSMIAADYLERTYGYDIDFLGLVANANAFMADTIQSDLYTPEMIQMILPQYTPDEKASYAAASVATGLDENELKAALGDVASLGVAPLFAGLVGAGFMGKIKEEPSTSPVGNSVTTGPVSSTTGTSSTGTTPGNSSTGTTTGTTTGTSSTGTTPGTSTSSPTVPGTTSGTTPGNDVEIDQIIETDISVDEDMKVELGVIDEDGNVDYDQLAMEEYQFETESDEIEKFRRQIIDDVESKYSSGDFPSLSNTLREFGYSTPQIATILASKSMTMTAILDGNTRNIVAEKAVEMAKADGVENYKSKYNSNPSIKELSDTKKPLKTLHLNSDNKKLVKMEDNLDELEESYRTKVDEANKLLDEAATDKKAVDAIKEKYEKEYGTDTSKWTEEAANEYDKAIDKYNDSAEAANKAIEDANDAKKTYQDSREEFEKACEDYYKAQIIEDEENNSSGTSGSDYTADNSSAGSNISSSSGASVNDNGTFDFGNVSTGTSDTNSSNNSSSGVSVNDNGTFDFGSMNSNSGISNGSNTNSAGTSSNTNGGTPMTEEQFLASLGFNTDKDNN